jgi:hypothetical protein
MCISTLIHYKTSRAIGYTITTSAKHQPHKNANNVCRPYEHPLTQLLQSALTLAIHNSELTNIGQGTIGFLANPQGAHQSSGDHVEIALLSPWSNIGVSAPSIVITAGGRLLERQIAPERQTARFYYATRPTALRHEERSALNRNTINHRTVRWAEPPHSARLQPTHAGQPISILRAGGVQAHRQTPCLTPRFFVDFNYVGKSYAVTFWPIARDTDLLTRFETSLAKAVRIEDRPAFRESLANGYSLEMGFWGRTIRRRIRGEGVTFPGASFNAFMNCVRAEALVTIV